MALKKKTDRYDKIKIINFSSEKKDLQMNYKWQIVGNIDIMWHLSYSQ